MAHSSYLIVDLHKPTGELISCQLDLSLASSCVFDLDFFLHGIPPCRDMLLAQEEAMKCWPCSDIVMYGLKPWQATFFDVRWCLVTCCTCMHSSKYSRMVGNIFDINL